MKTRDLKPSRHSRDCVKTSGRLTGRKAELLDSGIDLESSVVAHTLTPRTEEETGRHEAGNHFSLQLYEAPGYKSLYLTPVSRLVLWVLYIPIAVVQCNLELCACVCACMFAHSC